MTMKGEKENNDQVRPFMIAQEVQFLKQGGANEEKMISTIIHAKGPDRIGSCSQAALSIRGELAKERHGGGTANPKAEMGRDEGRNGNS